ncbi:MAG: DUF748 domain-containing protein [Methylococcaceae bacterium]|nr:MAG: DUF748 domain-containing protein [Methylococcaceae bacterium]
MALRLPKLTPVVACLLALSAVMGGYSWLAGAVVPGLVVGQLSHWNAAHPELQVSVRRVRFHPFQIKLSLGQVAVTAAADTVPQRLSVDKITLNLGAVDSLLGRRLTLAEVRIVAPRLEITDQVSALAAAFSSPEKSSKPVALHVDHLALEQGSLSYRPAGSDATRLQWQAIRLQLDGYAGDSGKPARVQWESAGDQGEKLLAQASFIPSPFSLDVDLQGDDLALPVLWRRWVPLPALALQRGKASWQTPIHYHQTDGLSIGPGNLTLHDIALNDSERNAPLLQAPRIALHGVKLDVQRRRFEIDAVSADKAALAAWLTSDGALNYSRYFSPAAADEGNAAPAWHYRLGKLALSNGELRLHDESRPDGLQLLLAPLALHLESLTNEARMVRYHSGPSRKMAASDVPAFHGSLDSRVDGRGQLALQLAAGAEPGSLALDIQAGQIDLTGLNGYLQSIARLKLVRGELDLAGRLEYQSQAGPSLRFNGEATVRDWTLNRRDDDVAMLKWRRLDVKGLRLAYPDVAVHVGEIIADQPYARIAIEADQSFNWSNLSVANAQLTPALTPEAHSPSALTPAQSSRAILPGPPRASANSGSLSDSAPRRLLLPADLSRGESEARGRGNKVAAALPINIDVLRIRDGVADFADHTLQPDFSTTIYHLEGAIKNLSSIRRTHADLLLEGLVDQYAPVRVQGQLNPFRAGAYSDIEMSFHNMDLTRLSPYSGKFAGYRIDKGKLSLDLHYHLEQRQLKAENQFTMDHLTLGERVVSKNATALPIGLAIALLRDASGKIDIHLPISGNLDDPQFSLRDLYAQAFTGLITKLVTSPFTVLGNLLEGDAEEYGRVAFTPGEATLSPYQAEKLTKLAEALQQRSGLTLEIRGMADPERDRPALTEARLQAQLRHLWQDEQRAQGKQPSADGMALPLAEADYRRLLLAQYTESGLGATKDQELAHRALLDKFAVDDRELRVLAQQRAERIREFLIKNGGVAEPRVYLLDVEVEARPGQELEVTLLLNGS